MFKLAANIAAYFTSNALTGKPYCLRIRAAILSTTSLLMSAIVLSIVLSIVTTTYAVPSKAKESTKTHEYLLANGLKLIVREDHRAPIAVFQIWYRVGSSYEPPGKTGISHVVEHLMFSGTSKLGPGKLSELVAQYGGNQNAFTSRDYTGYYQIWEKSRIPLSFEIEADRMTNLAITPEAFNKEIKLVMEERRLRIEDNPSAIARERFYTNAYTTSTYQQPPAGWMSDLSSLTLQDAQHWYQQWYAPNNAVIIVAGDVDPINMYDLAERFFGKIEPKDLPRPASAKDIAPLGERRMVIKSGAKRPGLMMGFNVPTIATAEDRSDVYALIMLSGVLDGGYSARIETQLIRDQMLATSAVANYNAYSRGDGLFNISGTPNDNVSLEVLEAAIMSLITDLQKNLTDSDELERVKAQVISSIVYEKDSISGQAQSIGALESMGLTWQLLEEELDALKQVTPSKIQEVANKYLVRDRLTVAQIIL